MTALKTIISAAVAGLLGLDAVQAGQFLLSRPALVGPLVGWINGCPAEGAKIGILLELIYIDFIPVGGVVPPNGTAAAAVGVLAHSSAGLAPSLSFFIGMLAGVAYSPVEYRLRAARSGWNAAVEAAAAAGTLDLRGWFAKAMLLEDLAMTVYVLAWALLCAGLALLPRLYAVYPASDFAYSLMPWIGLSGLYFRFRTQAKKKQGA